MVSAVISRLIILVFGTLYPGYASYKAVKTKNVKEYVKWMMYWIVFALFTTVETFTDLLLSWLPFYYELKIVFVLWMLSPATKGSSILYRKFVHPQLMKREKDIDECIDKARTQGYTALVKLGSQGINMAIKTAITSQTKLVDQLKKSYSMGDISAVGREGSIEKEGDVVDNRLMEEELQLREQPIEEEDSELMPRSRRGVTEEEDYENLIDEPRMTSSKSSQGLSGRGSQRATRDKNAGLRRAYSHKEAYHYATLPRQRTRQRSRQPLPDEWTED